MRESSLIIVSCCSKRTFVQVVRNLAMWTFKTQEGLELPQRDYRERSLWDPLVEPLLDLATETESHELLVEVCELSIPPRQDAVANDYSLYALTLGPFICLRPFDQVRPCCGHV